MKAAGGTVTWESVAKLPDSPSVEIKAKAEQLLIEAEAFEASMNVQAKAEMVAELGELEARRKLAEIKTTVLDAISKFALISKLQGCVNATATAGISRKSTSLSKEMASQEVADALNAELRALNVHDLQIVMKPESTGEKLSTSLLCNSPVELPRHPSLVRASSGGFPPLTTRSNSSLICWALDVA